MEFKKPKIIPIKYTSITTKHFQKLEEYENNIKIDIDSGNDVVILTVLKFLINHEQLDVVNQIESIENHSE